MALDLVNKDMSTGQIVLSTYDIAENAVRVTGTVDIDPDGLATEAKQDDIIDAIEALEGDTSLSPVGTPVYSSYLSTPVTTAAYVQLVASTPADVKQIEIFDSSGQSLYLATGAALSEANKILVIPGGNGRIPFVIPAGTRLSLKALTANAVAGYITINFYA